MKKDSPIIGALSLIVLVLVVGLFVYTQKLPQEPAEFVEAPLTQATSTGLGDITDAVEAAGVAIQNIFLSSAQKCEQEVRNDITALPQRKIQVSFLEVQSFTSAALVREFIALRGYTNPSGRALTDIAVAQESKDFSVAIVALRSELPSKNDESQLVTMQVTQPVVCISGSLASNSKSFLTTILKNESGVRSALYQSGEVVD